MLNDHSVSEMTKNTLSCIVVLVIFGVLMLWPTIEKIPLECFFSNDPIICAKLS